MSRVIVPEGDLTEWDMPLRGTGGRDWAPSRRSPGTRQHHFAGDRVHAVMGAFYDRNHLSLLFCHQTQNFAAAFGKRFNLESSSFDEIPFSLGSGLLKRFDFGIVSIPLPVPTHTR